MLPSTVSSERHVVALRPIFCAMHKSPEKKRASAILPLSFSDIESWPLCLRTLETHLPVQILVADMARQTDIVAELCTRDELLFEFGGYIGR